MAAVLKHWREAATLILATSATTSCTNISTRLQLQLSGATVVQPSSNGVINKETVANDNFEILMLKRSSKSKFMPNLYVFPGGVAVDNDFSSNWLTLFNKMGSEVCKKLFESISSKSSIAAPMFTRQRDPAFSGIPSEVAFRICAIRETFEESGVLLVRPAKQLLHNNDLLSNGNGTSRTGLIHEDVNIINGWRDRVNKDPNEFLVMCLELDLIPEVWSLYEWSNWLTPARDQLSSRRFDTIFFVCCVDHKPSAVHDFSETVNSLWGSPSSILSAYFRQRSGLAPPQLYELARLLSFNSTEELLQLVSQSDRDRVERWCPMSVGCQNSVILTMPGDDLYPDNADVFSKKEYTFSETLEELDKKFPNHHRHIYRSDPMKSDLQLHVTIPPKKGHVLPQIDLLEKLTVTSSL